MTVLLRGVEWVVWRAYEDGPWRGGYVPTAGLGIFVFCRTRLNWVGAAG